MTAYELRISDWSSDVCSSDLADLADGHLEAEAVDRHRPTVVSLGHVLEADHARRVTAAVCPIGATTLGRACSPATSTVGCGGTGSGGTPTSSRHRCASTWSSPPSQWASAC